MFKIYEIKYVHDDNRRGFQTCFIAQSEKEVKENCNSYKRWSKYPGTITMKPVEGFARLNECENITDFNIEVKLTKKGVQYE